MSLLNTRLQNLRAQSNLDKWETRPSRYGALDLFSTQSGSASGIITPDLKEKAARSIGRLLEVPVIDFDSGITISNTRALTIADSENTSQMLSIGFATYSWGFTMTPSLFMNNEIEMQRDFNAKFLKYLYLFATTLDNAAITELEASKTQVINELLGMYAVVGNTIDATYAQREELLGDLNVIMHGNDFYGDLHVLANAHVESLVRKLAEKGLYNEVNKQIQYADKLWHWSNNLANGLGKVGTGFIVNQDSLGMLARFEREALLNTKSRTGHEWGMESLPVVDMPVGTYYYEGVGDYSTIAGAASADMTRAWKQHYGFSVDVAFLSAYNSNPATLAGPIIKFQIDDGVV